MRVGVSVGFVVIIMDMAGLIGGNIRCVKMLHRGFAQGFSYGAQAGGDAVSLMTGN